MPCLLAKIVVAQRLSPLTPQYICRIFIEEGFTKSDIFRNINIFVWGRHMKFIERLNNHPLVVLGLNILSIIGFIVSIAAENIVVKLVACGIFGLVIVIVVALYCRRKFSAEKIKADMYNKFDKDK